MTPREIVKAIGEELLDFLLASYPEGSKLKLTIDNYTFHQICKNLGLSDSEVNNAFKYILTDAKSYPEAIAIASFQTVIAYNVKQSGYYEKLQDTYKGILTDNNDVMKYFKAGQEELWTMVQKCFHKYKRNFTIPQQKKGSYRYVQYPYDQLVMKTNELIAYADIFHRHLLPHKAYTLDSFKKIINIPAYDLNKEFELRLIYSFYLAWDGQESNDYRKNRVPRKGLERQENNSYILYTFDTDSSFELKQKITDIKFETIVKYKGITTPIFFNYDEEYKVWTSCRRNMVDPELSNGVLLNTGNSSSILDDLTNYRAYKVSGTNMVFLAFDDMKAKRTMYSAFHINIIQELSSWLSGGIKLNRSKTYALNALPKLNFARNENEIYINRNSYTFSSSKYINLNNYIKEPGEYFLKLPNRPSTSIKVEEITPNPFTPDTAGWSIGKDTMYPSTTEEWHMKGLMLSGTRMKPITDTASRALIRHKEQFECRFDRFNKKNRRF